MVKSRWVPPSRPLYAHLVIINGRQPAGRTPKSPVPHDAVLALFHSTRICTAFPVFTPVTLPYWLVISVWVTESYSGENVGHRPGERAAVLHRATIGITEIAIRFQNEITLAATITPRPRTMRDDRRPPTLRNCTELSTGPRVSARAFPVDANLRDLARLHAGHGAILRFNQSLGYGKL